MKKLSFTFLFSLILNGIAISRDIDVFTLGNFFEIEYVSDPQISPEGKRVVYVRNFADIMTDRRYSNLWIINRDGSNQRPLTTGHRNDRSPRWLSLIHI